MNIIPFEAAVRRKLARRFRSSDDIDEVIQEAYSRLAALESVAHIDRPEAYFFSVARNLLIRRIKRAKIIDIEAVAELEALAETHVITPEQETAGRREYARVRKLISQLPARCQRIIEMRKIEGLSQREVALRLGVSESVVENDVGYGIREVLKAMRAQDASVDRMITGDRVANER